MTFSTFIAKLLSLYFALLSGVYICSIGPYVHLTCCISKYILNYFYIFSHLRKSNSFFNNILSLSSAVSVSLSFNAPLTGVMYVIELTGNILLSTNIWKYFYISIFCFIFRKLIFEAFNSNFYLNESNSVDEFNINVYSIGSHVNQAFKYQYEFIFIIFTFIYNYKNQEKSKKALKLLWQARVEKKIYIHTVYIYIYHILNICYV